MKKKILLLFLSALLTGCGDKANPIVITDVKDMPYRNGFYTGKVIQNSIPDGEGVFTYETGEILNGIFSLGNPVSGTFTYTNGITYTGEFNSNWMFEGNGTIDWSTTESISNSFSGTFVNGSCANQFGVMTYVGGKTKSEGIHSFTGYMSDTEGIMAFEQQGLGEILFGDNSFYTGGIYINKKGEFIRKGLGVQEMIPANISATALGINDDSAANLIIEKYEGEFNGETPSNWIYGNGIFYLVNKDNKEPQSYFPGFWAGFGYLQKMDDDFEYLLDERYLNKEVKKYTHFDNRVQYYQELYSSIETCDICFMGDSYMEMWREAWSETGSNYEEEMRMYNSINVGIGGTTCGLWKEWIDTLVLPHHPKIVIMNLGFNDLHLLTTISDTFINVTNSIEYLLENGVKDVVVLTIVHSPLFYEQFLNEENLYNEKLINYCGEKEHVHLIDSASLIPAGNPNYFINDKVHMNIEGYKIWVTAIKKMLIELGCLADFDIGPNAHYIGKLNEYDQLDGRGVVTYTDGNKLEAVFDKGNPVFGKWTYSNGMFYEGQFNSQWKFDGSGVFDWSTPESISNMFEGTFVNGSCANQLGKMTYIPARINDNGIQFFEGHMSSVEGAMMVDEIGNGAIRYAPDDYFSGEIMFSTMKNDWIRIGLGLETWSGLPTWGGLYGNFINGEFKNRKVFLDCYYGQYDALNHVWIYGNGVWCYKFADGTPACYMKGFWNGTEFIKNWDGEFGPNNLPIAYKNADCANDV